MDSNIDPEINAVSEAIKFAKYEKNHQSLLGKNNNTEVEDDDNHGSNDDMAVDTATQLLKVLAYQMPNVEKDDSKKDSYVYYDKTSDNVTNNNENQNNTKSINDEVMLVDEFNKSRNDKAKNATNIQQRIKNRNNDNPLNFVMMDPSTKEGLSKRLGRPRRSLINTETPQQSSLNNSNDSIISRFRFESSEGKTLKNTSGSFNQTTRQNRNKNKKVIQHANGLKMVIEDPSLNLALNNNSVILNAANAITKKSKLQPSTTTIVIENIASLKAKGRSTAKDDLNRFRVGKIANHQRSASSSSNTLKVEEQ